MRLLSIIFLFFLVQNFAFTQSDFYKNYSFTKADSLRGMLRPERTCYDVTYYDLNIKINLDQKFIDGYVDVFYKVKEDFEVLQIDLYENMKTIK